VPPRDGTEEAAVIAAALWHTLKGESSTTGNSGEQAAPSRWKMEGRRTQMDHLP